MITTNYSCRINAARGGPLAPVADLLRHERLAGTTDRIAGAAERAADATEEMRRLLSSAPPAPRSQPTPSRPVRLAPQPAALAGREDLLAEVQRRLAGGEITGPRVVALHGLGGAGKTSVALEHAYRHMDEYRVVWQFTADDEATLAAEFLMDRTGAADASAARRLAGELGGLPLALEQAAAYIQATGLSVASYLELFRERQLELLSRGDLAGDDKRVTTTWALAFNQIQAAPSAAGLLRLLACCAPEAIPLSLLLRPRPELIGSFGPQVGPPLVPLLDDPLAASDALAALRRYSLASAPVDGAVSVHRLVQTLTLAQLPPELAKAWRQAAAALIEAALPDDQGSPENWPAYAALTPHAQAALAPGGEGMAHVAGYLGAIGDRAAALALSQRVLEARQKDLGPEHPETLNAGVEVAGWTGAEKNAAAALDLLAALLPAIERVRGAEHPDTLNARATLAYYTGEAGTRRGRGTSSRRCCPSWNESGVPSTRTP